MNRSAHPNNKALKALGVAITESRRLRNSWIGPEHILLGLIADDEGAVVKAISHEGLSPEELRKAIESAIVRSKSSPGSHVGLTPQGKKMIELALGEAERLRLNTLSPEHLFLAILAEGENIGAYVLKQYLAAPLGRVEHEIRGAAGKYLDAS